MPKKRKTNKVLPPNPLWRSERTRKMPNIYGQNVMYGINARPFDSRIQALQAMMSSCALGSMDIDVARNVINAIMK